jgi:hypothetical protein
MTWQVVKLKEGELGFQLIGDGQRWHGRVHQGAMRSDVFWGLKALEYPGCREKVAHAWELRVPRVYLGHDNTGPHRRYLCFFAPGAASFVLRFEEYVSPLLLSALKEAYSGRAGVLKRQQKESGHEDSDREAVEHPPGARPDGGQGRSDDREGHTAGHEQDPGDPGLEERQQVARRPAKKAKKRPAPKRRAR